MRYLRQFMLIILITFLGEVCHFLIPLPVPASIYGLVIMLVLLETHLLPLENIKEAGLFLVEIMPVMFIPAAVELMISWGILKPLLLPLAIMIIGVTILVMVVSGHVTQFIIAHGKKKNGDKEKEALEIVKENRRNE